MRVRMLRHISGSRNGIEWPPAGGELDLPDSEAADLIANRYAEPTEETDATTTDDTGGPAADPPGPDGPPSGDAGAATAGSGGPAAGDADAASEIDTLRAEYRQVTGVDPDSRWRASRLRKEIDTARAAG